jgi:hypothetical protein
MKKSVIVRKPLPGEKPGYYNKTSRFLKKAQMGMEVTLESKDPQRMNQIYENIYIALKQGVPKDLVYNDLITNYVLDQQSALGIIKSALDQLSEEGYLNYDSEEENQQTQTNQEEAPEEEVPEEEDETSSSDAEQEELANSDQGYYDEEEAANNSNSHLETEEDQQQSAFKYGGYWQLGGESEEEYDDEEYESTEEGVLSQYTDQNEDKTEKPFSIEDLMKNTPGMQSQESFPDLSYYLGNYRPISNDYESTDYLPTAKIGGELPKFQYRGAVKLYEDIKNLTKPIERGFNFTRRLNPMTNFSAIRKAVPIWSLLGEGVTRLPWIGPKFKPKLATTFTQNRHALWSLLNGAELSSTSGIFSQSGSATNADGSLSVDRLKLYQDDVKKIIDKVSKGYSSFSLMDINPTAEFDGLISGVYPMDSKVMSGIDDNGFQFFELKHTFGPNQQLAFGATPSKAKELTFKNRFYFKTDPNTDSFEVFDQIGTPLTTGSTTKYDITRPLGTTMTRMGKYLTTDAGLWRTNTFQKERTGDIVGYPQRSLNPREQGTLWNADNSRIEIDRIPQYKVTGKFNTPYPRYMSGIFDAEPFYPGQVILPRSMGRLQEVSDIAPATQDTLGFFGNIGRGLENIGMSTWMPQLFGLGNPIRTAARNVNKLTLPTFGYSNSALGPNVIDPAKEGSYGSDIKNAMNYKYRLGFKAGLLALGSTYLGYKTYDAFANKCQCDSPGLPNYQKKDAFGKCTCGTDVGSSRILDPTPTKSNETFDNIEVLPDSMKFLTLPPFNIKNPTPADYWRNRDTIPAQQESFDADFSKGGISKKQFIKKFTSKFQEGGDPKDPTVGKGSRVDTLTSDIAKTKDLFKNKLKDNSNIALTEEIYKNAQSNPQILNMLMQNGPKENLADDTMGQEMPTAQYGYETEFGGFVDADAKEPLFKFIYGGNEAEYYEPDDLQEAQFGGTNSISDIYDYIDGIQTYNPNLSKYVLDENNTVPKVSDHNCPPGKVWNATYNGCVTKSKISYKVDRSMGNYNVLDYLLPWNRNNYAGTYVKQKSNPYYLGSRNPYTGQLSGAPIASYVTKRGILGRPKKYIDIYNTGSNGVDLSQLEQLMEQNKRGNRGKKDNEGINWNAVKYRMNPTNWDNKKEDKGLNWNSVKYKMNPKNWEGREKKPKKQYGGYLNQYGPGGINDPVLGNQNGFMGNVTQAPNTLWGAQQSFNQANNPAPTSAAVTAYNSNSNNFMQTEPTQQGRGLETCTEEQKNDSTSECYCTSQARNDSNNTRCYNPSLVGIENKINKNVDLEAGVNVFNSAASGLMNLFDPNKKTQCGPGTVWNSGTRTCEATNSMDLMAAEDQQDRGDWQDFGSKSGMFRYDQEGQDRSSRATYGQYGGYMQEGGSSSIEEYEKSSEHQDMLKRYHEKQAAGRKMQVSNASGTPTYMVFDGKGKLIYTSTNKAAAEKVLKGGPTISQNFQYGGSFEEDEEVYMNPEELEQFLQSGGQVEYL